VNILTGLTDSSKLIIVSDSMNELVEPNLWNNVLSSTQAVVTRVSTFGVKVQVHAQILDTIKNR